VLNKKNEESIHMNRHQTHRTPGDICPYTPWTVTMLDNLFRKLLQNPEKIIGDYIQPGMKVMDIGCGPGFFTLAMARMVGPRGNVIAIDVQKKMLDIVLKKSEALSLADRIQFHQCKSDTIAIEHNADFILSFYMVHEVPDKDIFFSEVARLLAPGGKYLVVEPNFHVSPTDFEETLTMATNAGFQVIKRPRIRLSHAALLDMGT